MKLDEILSTAGRSKRRKRVGRGDASGHGKTCGRGHKGRGQRSGTGKRMGYEGGQNPAIARLPKRGFSNAQFRKDYQLVALGDLERFDDGQRVDNKVLADAGLIDDAKKPAKVLANGELSKKLTVVVAKFSATAALRITQAGGMIETTGK